MLSMCHVCDVRNGLGEFGGHFLRRTTPCMVDLLSRYHLWYLDLKWEGLIDARHLSIALAKIRISPVGIISDGITVRVVGAIIS